MDSNTHDLRRKKTKGKYYSYFNKHAKLFRFLQNDTQPDLSCMLSEASVVSVGTPVTQEEESVQFSKLSYLGCTWVKAPRSETEAQKAMATLRAESPSPIPIILHVPNNPDGCVR